MAGQVSRAWGDAIDAVLDDNAKAGRKPDSLRGLAAALAAQNGSTQNAGSWMRTVRRIRNGQAPREPVARQLAQALGVARDDLPPASGPMTVQEVADHLEEVEASAVTWADVDQLLAPLREATLLLANGDTQGALRVLSKAAEG